MYPLLDRIIRAIQEYQQLATQNLTNKWRMPNKNERILEGRIQLSKFGNW